jgi:hypothetical protein
MAPIAPDSELGCVMALGEERLAGHAAQYERAFQVPGPFSEFSGIYSGDISTRPIPAPTMGSDTAATASDPTVSGTV